jgi:hypothetical protein
MGAGRDLNFDGFTEGSRPVLVDPSLLYTSVDDPSTSREALPLAAFRPPQFGDTELVGRNTFFGDGTNVVDLGLYKSFALPSDHRVLLRLEMYNAFNQVQFGFPARAIDTPATFGSITGTSTLYSPRVIQIAVRYLFGGFGRFGTTREHDLLRRTGRDCDHDDRRRGQRAIHPPRHFRQPCRVELQKIAGDEDAERHGGRGAQIAAGARGIVCA